MDAAYQQRIEQDTKGFTYFAGRTVEVGKRYVFVYPDFGTPVGLPDHLAHRFAEVEVVEDYTEREQSEEPVFHVRADDGWEGAAFESELFPLTLDEYLNGGE